MVKLVQKRKISLNKNCNKYFLFEKNLKNFLFFFYYSLLNICLIRPCTLFFSAKVSFYKNKHADGLLHTQILHTFLQQVPTTCKRNIKQQQEQIHKNYKNENTSSTTTKTTTTLQILHISYKGSNKICLYIKNNNNNMKEALSTIWHTLVTILFSCLSCVLRWVNRNDCVSVCMCSLPKIESGTGITYLFIYPLISSLALLQFQQQQPTTDTSMPELQQQQLQQTVETWRKIIIKLIRQRLWHDDFMLLLLWQILFWFGLFLCCFVSTLRLDFTLRNTTLAWLPHKF